MNVVAESLDAHMEILFELQVLAFHSIYIISSIFGAVRRISALKITGVDM